MTGRRRRDQRDDETAGIPIGDALGNLLRARGLGATLVLADVVACWETVTGADVAAHVAPVALRGRELVVEVDQAAWATQIQLLSGTLLARLSEELGGGVADQLSVRVRRPGQH